MHTRFLQFMMDLTVSGISFMLMITFGNFITMIAPVLSALYFFNNIKRGQVDKYYKGSWKLWAKSFVKKN